MSKQNFFKGTMILTCTGLASRVIGFFYRIFLSHVIGAQGLGLYQLIMPLQTLILAITASGIQTSLSRLAAECLALKADRDAKDLFCAGTLLSVCFSIFASLILYHKADFFAVQILKEPLTSPLLQILSFSLPLSALHSCVNSFYFAEKKTVIPSGLQLLEQTVRVGSSYLICLILLSEKQPVTAAIAAAGALISEIFAATAGLLLIAFHFTKIKYSFFQAKHFLSCTDEILKASFPLTLNRVLLTLLGGIETILIPQRLQLSGLSPSDALCIYGVFTGMALPLILFPSTVTNSASVMLMPSVAEMQALGYKARIRTVTEKACNGTFFLGIICAAFFFFFGPWLGSFLFHSPTAGVYIRTMAFICPFLYTNTALSSILHGLGRNMRSLIHHSIGILTRIFFVFFAVPKIGIRGYIYGILASEILLCALHLFSLCHKPSD